MAFGPIPTVRLLGTEKSARVSVPWMPPTGRFTPALLVVYAYVSLASDSKQPTAAYA